MWSLTSRTQRSTWTLLNSLFIAPSEWGGGGWKGDDHKPLAILWLVLFRSEVRYSTKFRAVLLLPLLVHFSTGFSFNSKLLYFSSLLKKLVLIGGASKQSEVLNQCSIPRQNLNFHPYPLSRDGFATKPTRKSDSWLMTKMTHMGT